jgi:hypothetical protein
MTTDEPLKMEFRCGLCGQAGRLSVDRVWAAEPRERALATSGVSAGFEAKAIGLSNTDIQIVCLNCTSP